MRLISAHIENFGKLSNEDFDFAKGLNVIYKENGWGKSTLATFLRAMFYGLEGEGKRDDILSERKRYAPWQGGPFGGTVSFETKGKLYEITRFFGSKATEDSFELRDKATNMISEDFSDNIGEELLEINSESFMHSVFISQNECLNAGTTDDINAKLGNISDGIDLNRYASTEEAFKNALNAYSPTRKTGEIFKMKARLSELKAKVMAGKGLEDTVAAIETRIADRKAAITEINNKLRAINIEKHRAAKAEADKAEFNHYNSLLKDRDEKAEELKGRRNFFKGDLPTDSLIGQWTEAVSEIGENEALRTATELSDGENALYISLLETFRDGIATEDDIAYLIRKAEHLEELKRSMEKAALNDAEENELLLLTEAYGDVEEASKSLKEAVSDWNKRDKNLAEALVLGRQLSDGDYEAGSVGRKKAPSKFALLLGVILCLAGGALWVLREQIPMANALYIGASLVGVGLLTVIICILKMQSLRRQSDVVNANVNLIRGKYDDLMAEADEIEEAIKELLDEHGMEYRESDVLRCLDILSEELFNYKVLLKKAANAKEKDCSEEIEEISKEISAYLAKFVCSGAAGGFIERLTDLKGKIGHFASLKNKVEKNRDAKLKISSLREALKDSLLALSINPGMDMAVTVEEVLKAYGEYNTALKIYEDALNKVKVFEESHDMERLISSGSEEKGLSLEEISLKEEALNGELESIRNSLATDERNFDEYEESLENWNEVRAEAEELELLIKEKMAKLSLLEKAEANLSLAKEKLTARYMEPLLRGFSKYYRALTGEEASGYHIDANAVITKEEKGKQRSVSSLSFGYKDLIGFCMRLANADAMYSEEKPFLIMDDPFVNLDDVKMEGAKKLLEEASSEYQIIYLTCRENRIG